MENIINWIQNMDLNGLVIAILSSSVVTAIITGCFTCSVEKQKAKAKIKQIELEKQKEMEAVQVQWEFERNENRKRAYADMVRCVNEYNQMHDVSHQCAAETAIQLYIPYAGEAEQIFLTELLTSVSGSNPFDGPDQQTVKRLTEHIRKLQ